MRSGPRPRNADRHKAQFLTINFHRSSAGTFPSPRTLRAAPLRLEPSEGQRVPGDSASLALFLAGREQSLPRCIRRNIDGVTPNSRLRHLLGREPRRLRTVQDAARRPIRLAARTMNSRNASDSCCARIARSLSWHLRRTPRWQSRDRRGGTRWRSMDHVARVTRRQFVAGSGRRPPHQQRT